MKTTIVVHTPFTLRLEGDPVMSAHGLAGVIPFTPGEHEVEQAIANHWFVKHHADPKPPQRALNEEIAQQHADMMREQLAAPLTAPVKALTIDPLPVLEPLEQSSVASAPGEAVVLFTDEITVLVTADITVLHTEDLAAMASADVAVLPAEQVESLATADVAAPAIEQLPAQPGDAPAAQPAAQSVVNAKTSRVQGKQGSNRPRK
jgi:hypothetical protein